MESGLVHPGGIVGIGPLRQWVLDHVDDPCVVMVDDDVTHIYSQVGFHKRHIEDADTARAIVERLAILAADAGVRVFGFQQAARPFTYADTKLPPIQPEHLGRRPGRDHRPYPIPLALWEREQG